jgi:MFS family permease
MKTNYGWVIVAVGALMTCVALGAEFSLAVYLPTMAADTGWSRAGISGAMTLDFLAMGLGGFLWGTVSDRFGPRPVVLCGAVLLGAGQILASRAGSLLVFQLTYGALVGIATGAVYIPLMAAVTNWFDRQRGLAVSLVSVGFGVAPMTMSPLARWFVLQHDWRWSMMAIGLIAWALMIPAALLLRRPAGSMPAVSEPVGAREAGVETSLSRALRSRPFVILAATFFFCCTAHAGPIFHTMSYAISCGIAPMVAVSIYSVEGLSGLGGRLLCGLAADRFGAKRVLAVGLLIQALGIGAYALVDQLDQFYVMAVVLGAAYGGLMPLYAVLARSYFSSGILGGVIGAAATVSSLGMALGPPAGGWIFDHYGSYGWLYLASGAVGLLAVFSTLSFPPVPEAA